MKQLFPKEIIENTTQVHQFEYRTKSQVIYSFILIMFIAGLGLLPFIDIPIYTTARGILKSKSQRVAIQSLYAGTVAISHLKENQNVVKGDTLFTLAAAPMLKQQEVLEAQQQQHKNYIHDLHYLIEYPKSILDSLQSVLFQKEWLSYQQQVTLLNTKKQKTQRHLYRSSKLYKKNVIPRVEYENAVFEHKMATKEIKKLQEQSRNNWQSRLMQYQREWEALENQNRELQQQLAAMVIKAPVSGVLKNVRGLEIGSVINAGQPLAEIAPDTDMIAECYLTPKDIGLLYTENPVNFQIDAFNYNQWGQATGKILSISKDIDELNGQPVFKVQCLLDQEYLQLQNGFKGKLNRGMTLNARFFLTERSLFELLYDTLDDWLNPANAQVAQFSGRNYLNNTNS